MTKIDIHVIINDKNYTLRQDERIMKGYSQGDECFKHSKTYVGSKKMVTAYQEEIRTGLEELHTNLKEISNYFIELFKITGSKYSCSRTKLGKLISIVAFVYAKRGEKLFDEKIYIYKSDSLGEFCGTTIQELVLFVGRDAYQQKEYDKDNNLKIPPEELKETESIRTSLKSELRRSIEDVFLNFGAYNPKVLGDCINPIILHRDIILSDESLELQKLHRLLQNYFNCDPGSCSTQKYLIDYLLSLPDKNKDNE